MKNKSILAMIEHIVMLLVFALATTVFLRMFALAENLSQKYEATDRAMLLAQNTAEYIKRNGIQGFVEQTGAVAGGENTWEVFYDKNWEMTSESSGKYVLTVVCGAESEYLFRAEVIIFTDTEEELFCLPVVGQITAEVVRYEEI